MKIILASQSPRRKELLESLEIPFTVEPSSYEEKQESLPADELVIKHAINKATEVYNRLREGYIIGVDTVGSYQEHVFEKPKNREDAIRMLKMLSGTTHEVYTGVCIIEGSTGKKITAVEKTSVTFSELMPQDIESYIDSKEGEDKAAGYAIQGLGALFVKKIDGDYFNVVGLPVYRLYKMFKKFGIDLIKLRNQNK